MYLFTGFIWNLNGVELDSSGLGKWLSAEECHAAMQMAVGSSTVLFSRGKLTRIR